MNSKRDLSPLTLARLQMVVKDHANAISNITQVMLLSEADDESNREWKADMQRVKDNAAALYQLALKRLAPEPYAGGGARAQAEFGHTLHALGNALGNISTRCQLAAADLQAFEAMQRKLGLIIEHTQNCAREMRGGNEDTSETAALAVDPIDRAGPATIRSQDSTNDPVYPARILVADDGDALLAFCELLKNRGHTVESACNGQEAMEWIANSEFDIVILDLEMPVLSGFGVLEELRRQRKLDQMSIIIISGLPSEINEKICIKFGAVAYLSRPVDFELLLVHVNACMRRQFERRAEVDMARQVQLTFLPKAVADYGLLHVQAFLEQAMGIGGDFFFHHPLGDQLLLAGVGDVTGKGLPAALVMARLTTIIKHLVSDCTPGKFGPWVVRLNNALHEAMRSGENPLQLTLMLFDVGKRLLQIAVFAQLPPLYRSVPAGIWESIPCPVNPLFATRPMTDCKTGKFPLAAGTHWLTCSDGITDAVLKAGGVLGQEGLKRLLASYDWSKPVDVISALQKSTSLHMQGPQDDATLLLIEDRTPVPSGEFRTLCTAASIRDARQFFEKWCLFAGFANNSVVQVLVGCDEVLTNILVHAYGETEAPGPVYCAAYMKPEYLRFIIRHQGAGIAQVDTTDPVKPSAGKIGGRGLGVIRRVFTNVRFSVGGPDGAEIILEREYDSLLQDAV